MRYFFLFAALIALTGCTEEVKSVSGTNMKAAKSISVGADGLTVEQRNISNRIAMDNQPDATKYLYVISAYTGKVLLTSHVKGKVTSSGKRLTPAHTFGDSSFKFNIGATVFFTNEVLGEDGTFGSSQQYLYWWDTDGHYHQHYVTGGQIVHISDAPIDFAGDK